MFTCVHVELACSCFILFLDTGGVVTPWGSCQSLCCQGNTNSLNVSFLVTRVLSPQVRPEEAQTQCAADPLKAYPIFLLWKGEGRPRRLWLPGSWHFWLHSTRVAELLQQQLWGKAFPSSHCLPGPASLPRRLSWHHLNSSGELERPLFLWPHPCGNIFMSESEANNIHGSETGSLTDSLAQCLGLKRGFRGGESRRKVCDLDPGGG